jgi:hypothetical protein
MTVFSCHRTGTTRYSRGLVGTGVVSGWRGALAGAHPRSAHKERVRKGNHRFMAETSLWVLVKGMRPRVIPISGA